MLRVGHSVVVWFHILIEVTIKSNSNVILVCNKIYKEKLAFHRLLGLYLFKRLYVVYDQIVKSDSGVHQKRNENSTPCEAESQLYIRPIIVLTRSTVSSRPI